MYKYKIFDYNILSEVKLDGDVFAGDESDKCNIIICKKRQDDFNPEIFASASYFSKHGNEYVFRISEVGTFIISKNDELFTVSVIPVTENDSLLSVYLLSWVMGIVLILNNRLALHGSVVVKDGGAWLFCGFSKAGKSTTVARLCNNYGFSLYCDDIALLEWKGDVPFVIKGIPGVKLWSDAVNTLGMEDKMKRSVRPGIDKYKLLLEDMPVESSVKVNGVYFIHSLRSAKDVVLTEVNASDIFGELLHQSYGRFYIKKCGFQEEHFKKITQLALCRNIKFKKIERPQSVNTLDVVVGILVEDMQ